jgi:hypothetical protein
MLYIITARYDDLKDDIGIDNTYQVILITSDKKKAESVLNKLRVKDKCHTIYKMTAVEPDNLYGRDDETTIIGRSWYFEIPY